MLLGAPSTTASQASLNFNPTGITDAIAGPSYAVAQAAAPPASNLQQLFRFSAGNGDSNLAHAATNGHGHLPGVKTRQPTIAERCLDSFYYHFYGGHPFVLPAEYFYAFKQNGGLHLDVVSSAMKYAGSLYIDVGPARAMYLDEALRLAYQPNTIKDGFLVQALLVLIVTLDGSCQQDRARQLLVDAERIALEIGLNTRQFAAANGLNNPVLEESWRRTWWDLWICDGMVAGVHRVTNFALFDMPSDVGLPCDELQYRAGVSRPANKPV
jgi:hypothetical protein